MKIFSSWCSKTISIEYLPTKFPERPTIHRQPTQRQTHFIDRHNSRTIPISRQHVFLILLKVITYERCLMVCSRLLCGGCLFWLIHVVKYFSLSWGWDCLRKDPPTFTSNIRYHKESFHSRLCRLWAYNLCAICLEALWIITLLINKPLLSINSQYDLQGDQLSGDQRGADFKEKQMSGCDHPGWPHSSYCFMGLSKWDCILKGFCCRQSETHWPSPQKPGQWWSKEHGLQKKNPCWYQEEAGAAL